MLLFVDIEGMPMQELAAILYDDMTKEIVDIFHAFVFYPFEVDLWSRLHVHGLNSRYLRNRGYRNPNSLRHDFYAWMRQYSITHVYANNPKREERELKRLKFTNINIPSWEERIKDPAYNTALLYKKNGAPIGNRSCSEAHSSFKGWKVTRSVWNTADFVKSHHGYHCALYDAFHIYLSKINSL